MKNDIKHQWSITGHLHPVVGLVEKGDKKSLGFLFGNILITIRPITTMLMAAERGKNWVAYF